MMFSSKENYWGIIGCGWLGLPFAKHLINNGDKVVGSTTSTEKLGLLRDAGIFPVLLSAEDSAPQNDAFSSCNYILLNIPPSSLKENYAETLLELCARFSSKSKIIFISSTSVYADKNQIVTEKSGLDVSSKNTAYIIDAEKALQNKLKERLTIIRMAGLVGAERHPVKFMSGKKYDHGKNNINLIHLDDCIGLIEKVIEQNFFGEILNGCSNEHPTKKDYYTWAAEQMNIHPPIFKNSEGQWKKVSNSKSLTSLNYIYKYPSPYDFPLNI